MSIFTSLRGLIWNTPRSSPEKSVIEEPCVYSPVTALCVSDLVEGPSMLDLVVRVEHVGGTVRVTTNSGTTDYREGDTVVAFRSMLRSRTGDYHLVPVR